MNDDSLNGGQYGANGSDASEDQAQAASWILELRSRLSGSAERLSERDDRVVFLIPLFVHSGALWTVLGEDVVTDEGALARVSFPAARIEVEEPPWPAAAALVDEVLGLDVNQALEIGELKELRTLGGVRVLPLVVAIPRPETVGRTLSVSTQAGLALFTFQVMNLLEPEQIGKRTVELPDGPQEVDVITVDDHQLWGPSLDVLEHLVGVLST